MYKVKNITNEPRRIYFPKKGWNVLNPTEELEVEYKPQEHPAFEITESNKNNKVEDVVKEEESSDINL